MGNIKKYDEFIAENNGLYNRRYNYNYGSNYGNYNTYDERAGKLYDLSDDPTVLKKTHNFFQKVEDRINRMAYIGAQNVKAQRVERGGGPNTGYETLFGIFSLVPNLLKRALGSTKFEGPKNDTEEEKLRFMKHTNDEFIDYDLPNIKSEEQLQSNVEDLYKRGKVRVGEDEMLDDIARNRVNTYYTRQLYPNRVMAARN